ncbi:hypothetical protein BMS3Abin12_01169 [bacterium BMS3Abin12]|nr:hypothetical protein BMS3Abin12_01169 [bacterium BMS3Abin12]
MFTRSATLPMSANPATAAMNTPLAGITRTGVPRRGSTTENTGGGRPSRDMAGKMRVRPKWSTNDHRGQPGDGARRDQRRDPVPADTQHRIGDGEAPAGVW